MERRQTRPRTSWWASQETRPSAGASRFPRHVVPAATPANNAGDEAQSGDSRAARLAALIARLANTIDAMPAGSNLAVEFADESDFSIRIHWGETSRAPASNRPRKRRSREVA